MLLRLLPGLLSLAWMLAACSGRAPAPPSPPSSSTDAAQLARCRRYQAPLPALLEQFRASQAAQQAVAAERYSPTAPPKPLDPEEQRRLTVYDQQTEQEAYDEAHRLWLAAEAQRQQQWQRQQDQRLQQSAAALAEHAAALKAVSDELVIAAPVPQLNTSALERWLQCRPEQFR